MGKIRLDKYLADMGLGTRSEVKKLLKSKQVTINGETATKPELKVDPETDEILSSGERVVYEDFEYYMLNKPRRGLCYRGQQGQNRDWTAYLPKRGKICFP